MRCVNYTPSSLREINRYRLGANLPIDFGWIFLRRLVDEES